MDVNAQKGRGPPRINGEYRRRNLLRLAMAESRTTKFQIPDFVAAELKWRDRNALKDKGRFGVSCQERQSFGCAILCGESINWDDQLNLFLDNQDMSPISLLEWTCLRMNIY